MHVLVEGEQTHEVAAVSGQARDGVDEGLFNCFYLLLQDAQIDDKEQAVGTAQREVLLGG